jgi:hypothetical protein
MRAVLAYRNVQFVEFELANRPQRAIERVSAET